MATQLIVLAHGIGDNNPDFYRSWEDILRQNHVLQGVTVKGLCWEDVLQKVEDQYPLVSQQLADMLAHCGFDGLKNWVSNDTWKFIHDYMMDVLVYVGLRDMWLMIQNECLLKLNALRRDSYGNEIFKESETILIGHSLGAAMLPHLVWREYVETGTIPYRGMILLASPLGFESPRPRLCKDFLGRMAEMKEGSRKITLERFVKAWRRGGAKRLKFISNVNDVVCYDAKFKLPMSETLVDLIPLRQGFDPVEIAAMKAIMPDCVEFISFGEPEASKIADNHDVLKYLDNAVLRNALDAML